MPITASDAISPAIEHTKAQLLKPFRFGQWLRLALVGMLAGELGSSGGCNFHGNFPSPPQHEHRTETLAPWHSQVPPWVVAHPWETVWLVIAAVVLLMIVATVFMYISSRMRFILFDSLIAKECHVRAGWRRRKEEGNRLFVWQILLGLASFLTMTVVVGVPLAVIWGLGWLKQPQEHIWQFVFVGVIGVLVLIAVGLVFAVIHVLTKDFVVPQMALEPISAMEAWRRLWGLLGEEKLGYAGYIGMKILLAIGAAMAIGFVSLFVMLIVLVPAGLGGVAVVLLGKAAGWTWNFYTIAFAVRAGGILVLGLMFLLAFLNVPATVFFPAYSLYFFAGRYRPLAELLWPAPPAMPLSEPPLPPLAGATD